ncbi:MAG: hypothetical protein R8K22_00465 [Mariprofundaceae bacterium]
MKKIFIMLLIATSTAFAGLAWQPPTSSHTQYIASGNIPKPEVINPGFWRVLTKRLIWKEAVENLQTRLQSVGLNPELIKTREATELHVFDDPRTFKSKKDAEKVKASWLKKDVEAEVLKRKSIFTVGLGRFSSTSYAELMQGKLKRLKKPYQYERRTMKIPAFRFIFPAMKHEEAESLWQILQNMGIVDPVIMPEERFIMSFGHNTPQ